MHSNDIEAVLPLILAIGGDHATVRHDDGYLTALSGIGPLNGARLTYHPDGRLHTYTGCAGSTFAAFDYDEAGRCIGYQVDRVGYFRCTYDEAGQLVRVTR